MITPSLLWVTAEPPNDRLGGGSARQSHLLRRIATQVDVDLLVLGDRTDDHVRAAVRRLEEVPEREAPRPRGLRRAAARIGVLARRRLTAGIAAERARAVPLIERARALAPGHDAVVVVHEALADTAPAHRTERWFLHLHHVAAARSAQQAAVEPRRRRRVAHRVEARNAARWLTANRPRWDGLVTVSEADAHRLGGGSPPVLVVPNGVDTRMFQPTPRAPLGPVVMTGSLDYAPNVDGARWFVDEVWDRVLDAEPGRTLQLVGRAPRDEIRDLDRRPGVEVHADVPDMRPWLDGAAVVVVPLRIGTGTRIKALEAMAAGRPVVGTTTGLEGLEVRHGREALLADEPAAFASAVVSVLEDDSLADRLAAGGRRLVEAAHDWDVIADELVASMFGGSR